MAGDWIPEGGRGLWENKITRYDPAVPSESLLANPYNYRVHPSNQQKAMEEMLSGHGWVGAAIVNERTGRIVDGHMRATLAIEHGEAVPVLFVDLDENTERIMLASYDPLTNMAVVDAEMYQDLSSGLEGVGDELQKLIEKTGKTMRQLAPEENADLADSLSTTVLEYGFASWGTTKLEITSDEVRLLDEARNEYVATNGDSDGFVTWLTNG